MSKGKYYYKEFNKHTKNFKYIITEDGHTMMALDIVKGLNQKETLLKKVKELENKLKPDCSKCKWNEGKHLSGTCGNWPCDTCMMNNFQKLRRSQ